MLISLSLDTVFFFLIIYIYIRIKIDFFDIIIHTNMIIYKLNRNSTYLLFYAKIYIFILVNTKFISIQFLKHFQCALILMLISISFLIFIFSSVLHCSFKISSHLEHSQSFLSKWLIALSKQNKQTKCINE